jgi:TatA/E family protein of Tat protein translocase
MLDIGIQELLVLMVLAILLSGPDTLPDLGRRLGRAMREFRRASDEFRSTVEQNLQINADQDISPPTPSPFEPTPASATEGGGPEGHPVGADGHGSESLAGQLASSEVGPDGAGQTAEGPLEPYWTSRGGRLLHRRECAWRARVPEADRIALKTAAEGWEQGLKPCPACDPKEVEVAS